MTLLSRNTVASSAWGPWFTLILKSGNRTHNCFPKIRKINTTTALETHQLWFLTRYLESNWESRTKFIITAICWFSLPVNQLCYLLRKSEVDLKKGLYAHSCFHLKKPKSNFIVFYVWIISMYVKFNLPIHM